MMRFLTFAFITTAISLAQARSPQEDQCDSYLKKVKSLVTRASFGPSVFKLKNGSESEALRMLLEAPRTNQDQVDAGMSRLQTVSLESESEMDQAISNVIYIATDDFSCWLGQIILKARLGRFASENPDAAERLEIKKTILNHINNSVYATSLHIEGTVSSVRKLAKFKVMGFSDSDRKKIQKLFDQTSGFARKSAQKIEKSKSLSEVVEVLLQERAQIEAFKIRLKDILKDKIN